MAISQSQLVYRLATDVPACGSWDIPVPSNFPLLLGPDSEVGSLSHSQTVEEDEEPSLHTSKCAKTKSAALEDVRADKMSSAQDPFYIVKEEIQESIDKLQNTFHLWEKTPSNTGERVHLLKELTASCESIEWQVDELDKAISVAAKDPSWYGINEVELDKRRRWTSTARTQVGTVKKAVDSGKQQNNFVGTSLNGTRQELMRLPNDRSHQAGQSNQYRAQDNDDFVSSETDRQMLLIKQQDEELDELSASVERIGGVGLTIHDELIGQERILEDLSLEMDSTTNRLDFVQKKVAMVMKKASAKGQIMMIAFLVLLFIVLFVLVFFT